MTAVITLDGHGYFLSSVFPFFPDANTYFFMIWRRRNKGDNENNFAFDHPFARPVRNRTRRGMKRRRAEKRTKTGKHTTSLTRRKSGKRMILSLRRGQLSFQVVTTNAVFLKEKELAS
jgi:hypothetical protein